MPPILRIGVSVEASGSLQATLELYEDDRLRAKGESQVGLHPRELDCAAFHGYWAHDPAEPGRVSTHLVTQAEGLIQRLGSRLFTTLLRRHEAHDVWQAVKPRLEACRIEIVNLAGSDRALLPWEFLLDPEADELPATLCSSFVRRIEGGQQLDSRPAPLAPRPLRVLAVTSPGVPCSEIPFSPTARLVSYRHAGKVQCDLLSAPTINQLSDALLEAAADRAPYHALQIDSWGFFADLETGAGVHLPARRVAEPFRVGSLAGSRGYLPFERHSGSDVVHLLDGRSLGELLRRAEVPLLVLACRGPYNISPGGQAELPLVGSSATAFHSLAADALTAGVEAAVILPHEINLTTAALFLCDLYAALSEGASVGQAVTAVRKRLYRRLKKNPAGLRFIRWDVSRPEWRRGGSDLDIGLALARPYDCLSPVVYEPEALRLVDPKAASPPTWRSFDALPPPSSSRPPLEESRVVGSAPCRPETALIGREDILLTIDGAWRSHYVALVHGEAAVGKSALARELITWYAETGRFRGAILYTSLDRFDDLWSVLAELADALGEPICDEGERLTSLTQEDLYDRALELLRTRPLLWIWDEVDAFLHRQDGPQAGTQADRRMGLRNLLQLSEGSRAKFVLLSRGEENDWLQGLAYPVPISPLPLRERFQLAQALLRRRKQWSTKIEHWRDLLAFTQGCPLAVRCVVEQAVLEGLRTKEELKGLLHRLRAAPASFVTPEGRDLKKSTRKVLNYVRAAAFGDAERSTLALLHFFQSAASRRVLSNMRTAFLPDPSAGPVDSGQLQQDANQTVSQALEQAARLSLLHDFGDGLYEISRIQAVFFRELFQIYCHASQTNAGAPDSSSDTHQDVSERKGPNAIDQATSTEPNSLRERLEQGLRVFFDPADSEPTEAVGSRALVHSFSAFGRQSFEQVRVNGGKASPELARHETNLLQCSNLGGSLELWDGVAGAVLGLGTLYEAETRWARWEHLVNRLLPECAQLETFQPLEGRESLWRVTIGEAALMNLRKGRLYLAERLQQLCADYDRSLATACVPGAGADWSPEARSAHRRLAESLFRLSGILIRQNTPSEKVDQEAVDLLERLGEREAAARWAIEFGSAYAAMSGNRGLPQADQWLKQGLTLIAESQTAQKAACLAELGRVAWLRSCEARQYGQSDAQVLDHLAKARACCKQAIDYESPDNAAGLASHHLLMAHVSAAAEGIDCALPHYREAIRFYDQQGESRKAAELRVEVAIDLRNGGQPAKARQYALEARSHLENGVADRDILVRCQRLLDKLEPSVST